MGSANQLPFTGLFELNERQKFISAPNDTPRRSRAGGNPDGSVLVKRWIPAYAGMTKKPLGMAKETPLGMAESKLVRMKKNDGLRTEAERITTGGRAPVVV